MHGGSGKLSSLVVPPARQTGLGNWSYMEGEADGVPSRCIYVNLVRLYGVGEQGCQEDLERRIIGI